MMEKTPNKGPKKTSGKRARKNTENLLEERTPLLPLDDAGTSQANAANTVKVTLEASPDIPAKRAPRKTPAKSPRKPATAKTKSAKGKGRKIKPSFLGRLWPVISFARRHKLFATIFTAVSFLLCSGAILLGWSMYGPHRGYSLDFVKVGDPAVPGPFMVGAAKLDITPDLAMYEPWTDADNDGRYNPDNGDTFDDRDRDGKFDTVWLAGFSNNRPAKGVHDPLWVRALALRNNGLTLVMVSIDSIGLFHDQYVSIRKSLDPALGITHVMFSATHTHAAPDTMGIWSGGIIQRTYDRAYLALVRAVCRQAIEEAVLALEPASMQYTEAAIPPEGYVSDSRKPDVLGLAMGCVRFTKAGSDDTIATVVCHGNHPEALASGNSLITSDFPHYLREGLEKGVPAPHGAAGFGGICLFFQGSLGGLMQPLHAAIPSRDGVHVYKEASFEKAQALGENMAVLAANAFRSVKVTHEAAPRLAIGAKTFFAPITGLYKYAIMLGLVHPGYYLWSSAKTEVNVLRIGDVEICTAPGELYPEIEWGKVESPEGADFPGTPVESPGLRQLMAGRMKMVFNLANDEVGYMIPRTQWDAKAPFAYGSKDGQYGEGNSGGPDVAGVYHREAKELLARVHKAFQ